MREKKYPAGHRWQRSSVVDEEAIDHERQIGQVIGVGNDVVRVRVAQREDFDLLADPVTRRVSDARITLGETFELTPAQARELAQVLIEAAQHAENAQVPWRPRLVSEG
ncbi:hypothetical protein LWF15_10050 [Kineosporia rhizophila]|uniref:hypothetical protein n=1 Tax=Kineosporia rhizophila TaxID=84633 RepID=UPI001E365AF1|nr:hypothetical protein [Kineosporia rhizophila]MCE0535854.1 hypothetical protein [Kineosporia rhizophila]